jgi:hypothetical protein
VFSSSVYTWKSVVDIEHDASARLKMATYRTLSDSNIVMENIVSYTFVYDNNRIVKRIATPLKPDHDQYYDHFYACDGQGRLIADSSINRQTSKVERYNKYQWDNNNVTKNEDFIATRNGVFSVGTFGSMLMTVISILIKACRYIL